MSKVRNLWYSLSHEIHGYIFLVIGFVSRNLLLDSAGEYFASLALVLCAIQAGKEFERYRVEKRSQTQGENSPGHSSGLASDIPR